MKLSSRGLAAIQTREGERLIVYRDGAGNPTVCTGHLVTPGDHLTVGDKVSPALCEQFAHRDLGTAESAVNRLVKVKLTQHQFDALVSFTFNEGEQAFADSTLLKLLNAGNFTAAQAEFVRWHYQTVDGVKQPSNGLLNRRLQEAAQFGTPDPQPVVSTASASPQVADIPQAIVPPAPVAAAAQAVPPPSKVTQTRSGRALIGSAATGIAAGIAAVKPALDALNAFKAATDGLPIWLLAIAAPLAVASCAFALYGVWHKQRSLQGGAP